MPDQPSPCTRCGGDITDHLLFEDGAGDMPEYRCLVDEIQDVIADMESSDPPVETQWVEVVKALAEAHAQRVTVSTVVAYPIADGPETAGVFALLRDIADTEPLYRPDGSEGSTADESVWVACAACRNRVLGARAPGWVDPPHAFPHLISCPWARVIQIVGRADGR